MFFKQVIKATLVETFEEAIKVEKKYLTYELERSGKIDKFPRKRTEISSKSSSYKDKSFDVDRLQNSIRSLTKEVVGLKKIQKSSSSRGIFLDINLGKILLLKILLLM